MHGPAWSLAGGVVEGRGTGREAYSCRGDACPDAMHTPHVTCDDAYDARASARVRVGCGVRSQLWVRVWRFAVYAVVAALAPVAPRQCENGSQNI